MEASRDRKRDKKKESGGDRRENKEERGEKSGQQSDSWLPIFSKSINGFCQRHMEEAD